MRRLLPDPLDEVDPLELSLADRREPRHDGPWLMVNMIASVDGATAVDGLSGDLGGAGDKAVFGALRASCDWVLVASGTAVAERYRMPRTTPELTARRAEHGRAPAPGLAIVTASGRIDPSLPAFTDRPADSPPPLVLAGQGADEDALGRLDADVQRLAGPRPVPADILAALAGRGARVVLSEGGPRFNGLLHDADVIDEMCLSIAPTLVGGDSARIVTGAGSRNAGLTLDRLLEEHGTLFARYLRP